jgi:N-acetylglucosamine malate deacetylase 1
MNILAVAAHHDDIELGCGGTLARFAQEGHRIFGVVLTNSETHYTIRNIHRTADNAAAEAFNAAECIGFRYLDLEVAPKDNGKVQYDVDMMCCLEQIMADYQISMVFSHWINDVNTDHASTSKMTLVAARHIPKVLMYRSNWYQAAQPFNGLFHIDISDVMEKKISALECFTSEIENRGKEWIQSFIDFNRVSGFSIDKSYAEVFEPVRYVL